MFRRTAFTLIELLVVIAIIAILAAILFPVFAQAKESAKKATSISDMKQWALTVPMYTADSDDIAPLWEYWHTPFEVTSGNRSWGNLMMPYVKSKDLTKTVGSPISIASRERNASFPDPLTLTGGDVEAQKLFNVGWLTDYGYNYQIFTGFFAGSGANFPYGFGFNPQNMTSVEKPGDTLLLVTGVFDRDAGGGVRDGGQLPIDPPCRRWLSDNRDTLAPAPSGATGRYYFGGWQPGSPNAWNVFGGVWPYYNKQATVGYADGHAKTLKIEQISAGCDVRNSWGGYITNPDVYIWDRY
ncbi:MAG TPA: prepilin-type N-terminal cleavage/methylation domain-containing protein [Fimbriimonas sp.]